MSAFFATGNAPFWLRNDTMYKMIRASVLSRAVLDFLNGAFSLGQHKVLLLSSQPTVPSCLPSTQQHNYCYCHHEHKVLLLSESSQPPAQPMFSPLAPAADPAAVTRISGPSTLPKHKRRSRPMTLYPPCNRAARGCRPRARR